MKRLEYQKGKLTLYALLLIVAAGAMVLARNCSSPTWHVDDNRAGGDTINVEIGRAHV